MKHVHWNEIAFIASQIVGRVYANILQQPYCICTPENYELVHEASNFDGIADPFQCKK